MTDFKQVYSGDTFELADGGWLYLECCDCGLVHRITVKVVDGPTRGIAFTFRANKKMTVKARLRRARQ